jgi:hypothetical protein
MGLDYWIFVPRRIGAPAPVGELNFMGVFYCICRRMN